MDVAWGDGLGDETQGLDIVGVRGLDQSLEAALVNGITTISLRGRYFTVLPWAVAEFFIAEAAAGATEFDEARFVSFLTRVEFLVLACTTLDDEKGDPGGALGSVILRSVMAALSRGEAVAFPNGRSGGMLGTYFGPCRALGLMRTTDERIQRFLVTPRGKTIWETRKAALGEGPWRALLWEAEYLSPVECRALAPHFSLKGLAHAPAEAAALRNALLTAWSPEGPAAARVASSYDRFAQTVEWLRATGNGTVALQADALLADAWQRTVAGNGSELAVEQDWAEYEWRRRLHFALELLLSAVADAVRARGEATLGAVVSDWLEEQELPALLTTVWPQAAQAWGLPGAEAAASVPSNLYLAEAPKSDLAQLRPHARALVAFALVAGLASQSASLRATGKFKDRSRTGNRPPAGERALACVEMAGEKPFLETLQALAEIVVQAHLDTTFRKMGGRQKCSLRFFPEGSKLLTTNLATGAGRSGSRLRNVIKILVDAAVLGIRAGE